VAGRLLLDGVTAAGSFLALGWFPSLSGKLSQVVTW
jgi:hypothetical protein